MSIGLKGKELTKKLVAPCRLVVVISGTVLCGFFAVGEPFIEIFYGADKKSAWLYSLILIIPMFINMTTGILINVLDVANKRLTRSLSLLGTAILNVILTVILIERFSVLGAALGTAASLILGNVIVMGIYYKKVIHIEIIWLYKEAYKGLVPFQILAGVFTYFISNFISNVYVSLFVGGIMYVLLVSILIVLFGLNNNERNVVNKVFNKIKTKLIRA